MPNQPVWTNYFVFSTHAFATDGHLPALDLRERIKAHSGGEAYHCAFDLDPSHFKLQTDWPDPKKAGKFLCVAATEELRAKYPPTMTEYEGPMRPALGYVWFDFDSHDGGIAAFEDARKFVAFLGVHDLFLAYSGSKGFHVGVPFQCFAFNEDAKLGKSLLNLAHLLKKGYPTLDTTVYNANRKFRALGSKHPKTGLYKISLSNFDSSLEEIKKLAKKRGQLEVPIPAHREPLSKLTELCKPVPVQHKGDSISLDEWRRYRQPRGDQAFKQCGFLSWARDNPNEVNEPQWYAAASVVGRFENGAKQFHDMSKGHASYSATATDEKLAQALQASGPRNCSAIEELYDGCKNCPLYQKIKSPVVIIEADVIGTEATGFYDLIRVEGQPLKRVPNYGDLLFAFKRDHAYKTIADMKQVYTFNGTHYVDYTPIEIKAFAETRFRPAPKERERQEFTHKVYANEVRRRDFFNCGTENRINFKNGVFDIEESTLVEHSSEFGFRNVLPYEFDSKANCPTFDAWLLDVMLGDADLVKILQEFMGYVVRGSDYQFHKALWLSGSGRNGKSTFLSVLKALIGQGNYSTLSIKQITNDKFSSADLDGKIANFSEETSPEELSDSGPFKNLTGDGELLAQKKYGDPYSFRNRAKLIMTYNEVPQLKDLSPGMLSRPIIIPWKKDLTDESTQDKGLKARLLAELPGIFNFAFEGWQRLESQERFTSSEKSSIEMEEIRKSSCSAAQWIADTITFESIDKFAPLAPRQLYEAYKIAVGQYAFAEQKFYRRINAIPNVAKRRRRVEKGTEYISMRFRRGSVGNVEF